MADQSGRPPPGPFTTNRGHGTAQQAQQPAPQPQPQQQPQYAPVQMPSPFAAPVQPQPHVPPPQPPQQYGQQQHHPHYPPPQQPQYAPQPPPYQQPPGFTTLSGRSHLPRAVAPPQGSGSGGLLMISLKRAFRLQIDANEVLPDERAAMLAATPAITDDSQQAFLAWRRSVLFMAAVIMIPVALFHAAENLSFEEGTPEAWKSLSYLQTLVELGFCAFLWTQVGKWTSWRQQSRRLSWGWLVYFVTPFLVFFYPFASAVNYGEDSEQARSMKVVVGITIGARAFLSLAPKIISLLQSLIRASIATKTLFPGASAPGWLMVIAAPLYMIVFYVFVLLPYHFTGSELVVIGTLLVLGAKGTLVRAGLGLTHPMTDEQARATTHRAQRLWMGLLITGIALIIGGLWQLVEQAKPITLLNFALSMGSNILVLTLISTDALIGALDRARGVSDDERKLAEEAQADIAAFTATRV